ncbi:SCP-like protein [Ancylostoma duodenale]|uniref:SCP-like protein n=1 Tax=Ancylostoma duodenale TaxID=51022 RepID=A0A0C2FZY8_9BILA|nr:SCP-like protein [Ancylostoma duodenale]
MFVFLALIGYVAADYYCASYTLSNAQRELLLEGHNEVRRNIAFGRQENKDGLPPLGPAKNMYALDWDCELEKKAEESLAKCTLDEKVDAGRNMIQNSNHQVTVYVYSQDWDCELEKKAEESLAKCTLDEKVDAGRNMIQLNTNGGTLFDTDFMTIALSNWVAPVKFFGKSEPVNKYDGMHCQFANMVHANTTKVGCSFKRCGENFLFACLYDKCGVKEALLYENGQPCEQDDDCTTFYGSECEKGLCIKS